MKIIIDREVAKRWSDEMLAQAKYSRLSPQLLVDLLNEIRKDVVCETPLKETLEISKLENDIRCLLNKECAENESDTPDWVLASYLCRCLDAFNACVNMRERYYGRELGK